MNVLVMIGIRVLEVLFFAGWVGSAVVLLLTSIEDVETIFERKEQNVE